MLSGYKGERQKNIILSDEKKLKLKSNFNNQIDMYVYTSLVQRGHHPAVVMVFYGMFYQESTVSFL